jgi:hypothetical protein
MITLKRPEEKTFIIDGGVGRVICSIPALKKYARLNPNKKFNIVVWGWEKVFWGIKELSDKVCSYDQTNLFYDKIKNSEVINIEPYRVWSYYTQQKQLYQVFDEIINQTDDHKDLELPSLKNSKEEELQGLYFKNEAKKQFGKDLSIVIQPFGQSSRNLNGIILDNDSRSLEHPIYLKLVKKLSEKYNIILFAPQEFFLPEDTFTYKINADIRYWASIIKASDYFIGCDSCGQHIARGYNVPGSVIMGSTFVENTSYSDWFNILDLKKDEKKYTPIRLLGLDCTLSNQLNDRLMDFNEKEIENIYSIIVKDIETKLGKSKKT